MKMKSPPTDINLYTNAQLMILLLNTCTMGLITEEVTNPWLLWQRQCCYNNKVQVLSCRLKQMMRQVIYFAQIQAYPRVTREEIGTKLLWDLGQRNTMSSFRAEIHWIFVDSLHNLFFFFFCHFTDRSEENGASCPEKKTYMHRN